MKVAVNLIVEVDPEVWAAEYDIDVSGVRGDIRQAFLHCLYSTYGPHGGLSIVKNIRLQQDK